jgi:hypothetical protein
VVQNCPEGHPNPEGQRFCGACGAPLAGEPGEQGAKADLQLTPEQDRRVSPATGRRAPHRPALLALAAVGLALAGLAVVTNMSSGEGEGLAGSIPPTIRAGVEEYNEWARTTSTGVVFILVANLERDFGAPSRCGVGFDADFPEQVLITAFSSSGVWAQISVNPGQGVDESSWRSGQDYRLAGIDPADLAANTYPCTVESDGTISLVE